MREIEFKITKAEEGAAFAVHIVPGSAKNEVIGKHGDALKIRVTSTSIGSIANEILLDFLAEQLEVERDCLEVVAGMSAVHKMIIVVGLTPAKVEERLLP
ncbi:MAG: DUF167 domain-containing protein [Anaerolineae bacterium]|nr:DUF167 domain-containing protein [Anaerolineae bacterium]